MRETVRSVLFGQRETVTFDECRRCGTTVETSTATCPACGGEDIVSYRIR